MPIGTLGLNVESNILCRLYRTVNKPVKLKTSLAYEEQIEDPIERSHGTGGHTKTCQRHYQVSVVPETFTVQGPKRPPINGKNLTSEVSVPQENNRYFSSIYFT